MAGRNPEATYGASDLGDVRRATTELGVCVDLWCYFVIGEGPADQPLHRQCQSRVPVLPYVSAVQLPI
jgi:hypothetical protein